MSASHPEPGSRAPQSPRLQPLSQSSSSLLCEGHGQKPELHKSSSTTVWQTQQGEASIGPQAPEEEGHPPESPAAQAQVPSPQVPSPQVPSPQPRAVGHWRSSTVGNVSMMGSGDLGRLRAPSVAAVQRSHSDLARSVQTRGHGGARKASLSCSALGGGSPVHKAQLQPEDVSDQVGPAPAAVGQDVAPEDGTSNSAWMLGDSQAWKPPSELVDKVSFSDSLQAGSKTTGHLATASCHALPPAALLCSMREVATNSCCHAMPATGILAFPKLVASVSESGLQAQHGVRFHCMAPGLLPGHTHCCAHPWGPAVPATEPGCRTKDVWTMTSASDLAPALASAQDAGVQVAPAAACKAVATSPSLAASALHMFPEVTLGPSLEEALSPVRDVRWDAEGMTWEVYGASVDPEVLGVAIQKHLEMQFEQLQRLPASEDSLSTEGRRGPLRAVMQSLRRPSCCGCSGAAPE
ncbi:PREDICTED: G protein-regulated inducer of neurite outgrowth 2 isoform X2 [Chinchilla lanigera]|uniref:G protein regulated inducer of neurite outgrowth 2 n=2 Tax=Chinchilla lanigera TaxID=34839 RepID=A0A8C2W5A2_CHILA|nr:PREDICTED: G protein-regulated inducer of neurite outgrowth 2 isoform X2 [Chinchilla lanigera]XP_005407972.1 PREDICTED: G protein-regulated inducer of neurite outgrowth 2 isoform X2 [Chinchilla lanigera]XP_005407973.1 PREDICTED: G protein-regulated inducer of neurite outgrowth 2 isoform X2 [Chinchilla lanigera]XP_005407974.1 PREDICTED: G protein-regulated inducer of neurite outgrowth 2 isoform X2 [Chinchilla lanigera]XP_013361797.1 PREDICTED: G protein-regulated inducer of neurite outgrowth 